MTDLIEFLEMHRYRGRYADRTNAAVRGVALMTDGTANDISLNYGDLMTLNRSRDPSPRLTELGLQNRSWTITEYDRSIPTGDGAVILIGPGRDSAVSHVAFPLSPTQLLVIGDELPKPIPIQGLRAQIVERSTRWIIGRRGTLDFEQAPRLAKLKAADRDAEQARGTPETGPSDST